MPHFLDTNILLYSISRNPADAVERERAIALLSRDDGALSVQVLREFYVQAARPTRSSPPPPALGCRILYSEDMNHGREVEGITIVNPFRPDNNPIGRR